MKHSAAATTFITHHLEFVHLITDVVVLENLISSLLSPSFSFYTDELGPKHWPVSRFTQVMKLKQAALTAARRLWTDYILVRQKDHKAQSIQVCHHSVMH